ncbi:ABC-2 type transport system ATP-binding protein [Evansella caseinilytica]|uniref:ABC-2 type transport system ATP-binding protein n=1 Tax=Evansella caseinilytica TaxID=1503961 RepID=A0A1H3Q978_9BACI|nr:ABC transporter ATP-binding protein [Evansella caseinilytica]SDZ09937.1 ABC-2 type transport system ATP-binding protein [Evansella caseinilytica]
MTYIIQTHGLTKVYQGKEVVANVSMSVKKGEIYGFLGPNGAGKTTIMKMLTNLVKPTSGEINIFGQKLRDTSYEILKRMGSIIEYPIFYENLTAKENLDLHCEYMGFHDKKALQAALDMVNLPAVEDKKVKNFSLGMKQRLGIARAIITKPELLILDEPINGLDPIGIKEIRQLFKALNEEYGITLLISSHILAEIEQIADTIGVIHSGRLLEQVAMSNIREQNTEYIELYTNNIQKAAYVLESILQLTNFRVAAGGCIKIYESGVQPATLSKTLITHGVSIEAMNKKSHSLEDYFMSLLEGGNKHVSFSGAGNKEI